MADETEPAEAYTSAALNARELEWANNSPELLAEHKKINGPVVRTRYVRREGVVGRLPMMLVCGVCCIT
jgi:hypothetical protein